jgi:hypothetical protein
MIDLGMYQQLRLYRVGQHVHFRRTPSVTAYRVEFGSLSDRH